MLLIILGSYLVHNIMYSFQDVYFLNWENKNYLLWSGILKMSTWARKEVNWSQWLLSPPSLFTSCPVNPRTPRRRPAAGQEVTPGCRRLKWEQGGASSQAHRTLPARHGDQSQAAVPARVHFYCGLCYFQFVSKLERRGFIWPCFPHSSVYELSSFKLATHKQSIFC